MQFCNPYYFNNCKFTYKLLPWLICCFLFACSGQNTTKQVLPTANQPQTAAPVININTASLETLEKLPRIGEKTAREIIEHREKFGKFRKPEHLLLIRGISDVKFREMRSLIIAEWFYRILLQNKELAQCSIKSIKFWLKDLECYWIWFYFVE